eukprot:7302942-Pyramimonas_sp.AAC.1
MASKGNWVDTARRTVRDTWIDGLARLSTSGDISGGSRSIHGHVEGHRRTRGHIKERVWTCREYPETCMWPSEGTSNEHIQENPGTDADFEGHPKHSNLSRGACDSKTFGHLQGLAAQVAHGKRLTPSSPIATMQVPEEFAMPDPVPKKRGPISKKNKRAKTSEGRILTSGAGLIPLQMILER